LGTNLLVIPRGREGRGGLSSANLQAAMETNCPPGPSGSSSRSPARDANNGSGHRGWSDNGHSEDPDGSFIPQHLCCQTSSKDSLIIQKFWGKRGDDVERFLRAVQRRMNRNLEANKYYTEDEQNTDHVALIHRNCSSRVWEYIRSLKGVGITSRHSGVARQRKQHRSNGGGSNALGSNAIATAMARGS